MVSLSEHPHAQYQTIVSSRTPLRLHGVRRHFSPESILNDCHSLSSADELLRQWC